MTAQKGMDSHLKDGSWEPTDILADCPDGADVAKFMSSQGWEEFLSIGEEAGDLSLHSWRRKVEGRWQYLLQAHDASVLSPFMLVDSFPELMDLFSRWAPAVQAASITATTSELFGQYIDEHGLVERVAARAAYGASDLQERLQEEKRRRDRERRAQRQRQANQKS